MQGQKYVTILSRPNSSLVNSCHQFYSINSWYLIKRASKNIVMIANLVCVLHYVAYCERLFSTFEWFYLSLEVFHFLCQISYTFCNVTKQQFHMPASATKSIKINTIMCKIKIAGCGIFSNKDDISIFNIYMFM